MRTLYNVFSFRDKKNINCIGSHVTWSLRAHISVSLIFNLKNGRHGYVFSKVKAMKIKVCHLKLCKKRYPTLACGLDRQFCHLCDRLALLGELCETDW